MSTSTLLASLIAAALAGLGSFLLLPHRLGKDRPAAWRAAGAVAAVGSIVALASLWAVPSTFLAALFDFAFGALAIGAGFLMVTSRNPVYSALWFAMVVLSTSGLFLLAGAQFLAAGTIIVYAGAIIVTFLFVIMLAQSEGNALYDRLARSPGVSALVAGLLLGGLLFAIGTARVVPPTNDSGAAVALFQPPPHPVPRTSEILARRTPGSANVAADILARAGSEQNRLPAESSVLATYGTPPPHVAGLGATLFTDHLISVEVAGAILFVALVGAAAIATPRPPIRPNPQSTPADRQSVTA